MRFASSRSSRPRLRELVAALDEDDAPIAATWRLVGETAANLDFRARATRTCAGSSGTSAGDGSSAELRDVVKEAASTVAAGRVPSFDYTLGRLLDAQAALADEEACVSETQAFRGAGPPG